MYCHCVIAYSFEVKNNFTHRESQRCPKISIGSTMSLNFYQQSACLLKICIFCICQVKEACENALFAFGQTRYYV